MKTATRLEASDWDSDGTRTPKKFFDELNARYHFVCDLFASKENAKLPAFFTKERSAIDHEWRRLDVESANRCARREVLVVRDSAGVLDEQQIVLGEKFKGDPADCGWNYGNPPYGRGLLEPAVRKAIQQAKLGSGSVLLIPSSTGAGWFQTHLLKPCDVLDATPRIYSPEVFGYELSMQGIGYRQKILFLGKRVPFDPPIGYPEGRPWSGPAGDSVLVELRPPLR